MGDFTMSGGDTMKHAGAIFNAVADRLQRIENTSPSVSDIRHIATCLTSYAPVMAAVSPDLAAIHILSVRPRPVPQRDPA